MRPLALRPLAILCLLPFAACSAGGDPVPDAGEVAGPSKSVTVGESGGVLEVEGLRLTLPAGAIAAGTELTVRVTDEVPAIEGVTPLTPVFEFGPDGTSFAQEVFLAFDVQPATDEIPVLFWTNADGVYEAQPGWLLDGKLHALATHFSKGLIGSSKTATLPTYCCGGGTCGTRGVCNTGRCFCLPAAKLAEGTIEKAGALKEDRVAVYNFNAQGTTTATLTVRASPLRPAVLGASSLGPVVDVEGELREGDRIALCLDGALDEERRKDACLGYYDEAGGKWKCEDTCLKRKDDQLCGTTTHFTNFALLLGTDPGDARGCKAEDEALWKRACGGLQLCPDGTCGEKCVVTCAANEKLCPDGKTCTSDPANCPAGCSGTTPVRCDDGKCVGKVEECAP